MLRAVSRFGARARHLRLEIAHTFQREGFSPMPEVRRIIEKADFIDLRSRLKEEVLRELVDVAAKRPEVTDPEEFLQAILERERIISTGIGIGLAMPHVKIPSVKDFVLVVGRSTQGIDFDALDGHPVHIVAMIGASDRQSGEFLRVLAKLVLKLKDKSLRQRILLTPEPEGVRDVLLSDE
jgi:mannitol/fructose-specific phosphotransferase system IIA component (Ntr-type)